MIIDWSMVSAIATCIGCLAVIFGAWQVRITKQQSQAEFEDHFDQQYRELSMAIPVDVLIGQDIKDAKAFNQVRELIYNYLDLSNEQVNWRVKGRISKNTWESWSIGMKVLLSKVVFQKVYNEVIETADLSYLKRLVDSEFNEDPINWANTYHSTISFPSSMLIVAFSLLLALVHYLGSFSLETSLVTFLSSISIWLLLYSFSCLVVKLKSILSHELIGKERSS